MDYSRLISLIFRDKPGVMYENPPPPSDDFLDNFEPVSFTYHLPQSVKFAPGARFIQIDRSLIHKSLLGCVEKRQEQTSSESTKGDENGNSNENIDNIKTNKTEESSADVSVIKNALEKRSDKKKKKEGKHKNRSKGERGNDIDSDDLKTSKKKKDPVIESSALQSISKLYSMTESDSDNSEKHSSKLSSHHAKSHSKKSSRHKKKHKHSRHDSSYSDVNPYDKVSPRSAEFSVKQDINSSDEENFSSSFSKKVEISLEEGELPDDDYRKDKKKSSKSSKKKYDDCRNHDDTRIYNDESFSSSFSKKTGPTVKEEVVDVLSDEDDYRKDKIKSSKRSKKKYDSRTREDSWSNDGSKIHNENFSSSFSKKTEPTVKEEVLSDEDDYRKDNIKSSKRSKKKYDSRSRNDSWSSDDSRNQILDSRSYNDSRTHDDSRKNHSNYSSDDDSRKRHDESNGSSRCFSSCMQKIEQEIKQEPGSASYYVTNDYYCDVCKLMLNSETTYSTHMAGKKHKKALRHLSEQKVAKSSVLEIKDSQKFPKPADMDRIELHQEESKIQETCDNADLLIVGLDNVREILGHDDTKYICDLCDAQCVANSIIKHLIGIKHQMNCLKTYCPNSYIWVKDRDRRDRRVEREINYQLEGIEKTYGRGRIRVFKDVKRKERSPEPFNPYQPSTSRQILLPKDVPDKKADEQKATDKECLSRDFSDFYCKVCDAHMNNLSMWESHANGRKHAKNKKKAEDSGGIISNFTEAPRGTISHLEEMIKEQCDPDDIIVGLNFIRENRGENGDLYNCFLCGSVSPTIDIIDHLYLIKHKTKYLEKMHSDGYHNAIHEINSLALIESSRQTLVDAECAKIMHNHGQGKVVIALSKKTY